MIYNETAKEVYIGKQGTKPNNSNNHNTDEPDISLDKRKQEIEGKNEGKQEVRKTKIMKEAEKNGK